MVPIKNQKAAKKKIAIISSYFSGESYGLLGPQTAATIIAKNTDYDCIVIAVTKEDDKSILKNALSDFFGSQKPVVAFSLLSGREDLFNFAKELTDEGLTTFLAGPQSNEDYQGEKAWRKHPHRFKGLSRHFTFALHGPAEQAITLLAGLEGRRWKETPGLLYAGKSGEMLKNPRKDWTEGYLSGTSWDNIYRIGETGITPLKITMGQVLQQIGCPYAAHENWIDIPYPSHLKGRKGANTKLALKGADTKLALKGANTNLALKGADTNLALKGANTNLALKGADTKLALKGANTKLALKGANIRVALKGCSFCDVSVDKGFYGGLPIEEVVSQIQALPLGPDGRRIPFELINENPIPGLPSLLNAVRDRGLELSQINLILRADWFLRGEKRLREALKLAGDMKVFILLASMGFESFDDGLLFNLNKGLDVKTNLAAIRLMRHLKEDYPDLWGYSTEEGAVHGFIHPTPWDTEETSTHTKKIINAYALPYDILPKHSTPLIIHHASCLGDWIREIEQREGVCFERYGSIIGWWPEAILNHCSKP